MIFHSKFIFDDAAAEGGGGAAGGATTQEFLTADEAKGFGFDSKEQLAEFIRTQREAAKPDTEKQKEEEVKKANFLKYSTDNDLLNVDDYNSYENIKSKQDRDLVFDKFKAEFKEDNPEIDDDDFDEECETAFDNEYKLNSRNEKTKVRGEARLKDEAAKLRSPYQSKYDTAISQFNQYTEAAKSYPEFNKFIDEIITENTPEKFVTKIADNKIEVPVEIEITKEQKEELGKIFKSPKYFNNYLKGEKKDELKAAIAKKIQGYIKTNNFETVVSKAYTTAAGIYLKKGSNAGAENQYGLQQTGGGATVVEMNAVAESNNKRAKQRSANK